MALWRTTVEIICPDLGGNGTNTWHVRVAGGAVSESGVLDSFMDMVEQFYTDAAGILPDNAQYVWDGVATGIGENEGNSMEQEGWALSGSAAGNALPPANCMVVGWRTDSGGRSGRGRTFMGPITLNALADDGSPSATALTTLRTAAATLVESSDSLNDGALGVWSTQESVFRDFTGSAVRNVFAVLRSRRD